MNNIEVENVSLRIKKDFILKNVSVVFSEGKIHGLVGRNGSGKTMLLKCICGFIQVTKGKIVVNGKSIGKDCDFPENVGIIIETPGFIPYYSGIKNLNLLAGLREVITEKKVKDTMRRVGLDPDSKKHVGKYSLGMRQRLGIAQAIMEDPDILILDEPMNGLDNHGVEDIRTLLLELKKEGKTIVIASHSAEDIDLLCDTVHEMDAGVIRTIRENALEAAKSAS